MQVFRRLYSKAVTIANLGVLLLVCVLAGGTAVLAQTDQGTITGTITDSQGAVVPGAQVKLTNTATGLVLQRATNSSGIYVFSPVRIGTYDISVSAQGFATTTQNGLVLNVNQSLAVDLKLNPGSISQTVTVQGGAAQLMQSEDA